MLIITHISHNKKNNLLKHRKCFKKLLLLTIDTDSLDTLQNVICLPVIMVCSTRFVKSGSDQGNCFKCDKNVRSWNSTGSEMISLSVKIIKLHILGIDKKRN